MYTVHGERGGLSGGPTGLAWRYYDPQKAPEQITHPQPTARPELLP